jgi:hypothetical protein
MSQLGSPTSGSVVSPGVACGPIAAISRLSIDRYPLAPGSSVVWASPCCQHHGSATNRTCCRSGNARCESGLQAHEQRWRCTQSAGSSRTAAQHMPQEEHADAEALCNAESASLHRSSQSASLAFGRRFPQQAFLRQRYACVSWIPVPSLGMLRPTCACMPKPDSKSAISP